MGLHSISCLWIKRINGAPGTYRGDFYVQKNLQKSIDKYRNLDIMCSVDAGVAHPVERHLAKVEVASSSLVTRSKSDKFL